MKCALLITDVTQNGGVTTHLRQLCRMARTRQWSVALLMDDNPATSISEQLLRAECGSLVRAKLYHGHHEPDVIVGNVEDALLTIAPDLVHVHCGSPRSALIPRERVLAAQLPLVSTEHFVSRDQQLPAPVLRRMQAVYAGASTVISVCEDNRAVLRDHFGLLCSRHVIVRYPVELSPERCYASGSAERVRILCLARLTARKGVDVLIRAMALLDDCSRSRLRVTIAGEGELRTELEGLVHALGVSELVSMPGWSSDVGELLHTHDLFVLPSFAEGQPIALLEALAAGLPVIATAVSGIPEALGYGSYGELVPAGDPPSLSASLARFCANPSSLREKAVAARSNLRAHHDPDTNLNAIIDIWEGVLHSAPQKAMQ